MPILLLAALGYLIYTSASNLTDKISFSPVGVNIPKSILQLKVSNPTDTSATIQNVSGSIMAGGTRIGTYAIKDRFVIQPFGNTVLNVKLNLDAMEVFNQVLSVISQKKVPSITITGSIGTSLGNIAFENTLVEKIDIGKNAA